MPSTLPILPFLLALLGAAAALIAGRRPRSLEVVALLAQLGLLGASFAIAGRTDTGAILVHRAGGWAPPVGIVYVADRFSAFFGVIVAVLSTAALGYALLDEETKNRHRVVALFFVLQAGMFGAVFTGDLFNLYVCFELLGIASYGLVAYRGTARHVEAALKYATVSLVASMLMLMGVGSIYAQTGTLTLASLYQASFTLAAPPLYLFSTSLILVSLALKAAIFPLHFWLPDAHSIAPTGVSVVLSGAVVKVGAYSLLRVLFSQGSWLGAEFRPALLLLAAATAVGAAWVAFAQKELKRFLAYSTASQMGYVLAGGALGSVAGLRGAVVYSMIHSITKGTLFLTAGVAAGVFGTRRWDRMGGLATRAPLLSAVAFVSFFSLAGIPPLAGFAGKLAVFSALATEGAYVALGALIVASLTILAAAGRIWLHLTGGAPTEGASAPPRGKLGLAVLMALLVLALGLGAGPLVATGDAAASQLIEGASYREAVLGAEQAK